MSTPRQRRYDHLRQLRERIEELKKRNRRIFEDFRTVQAAMIEARDRGEELEKALRELLNSMEGKCFALGQGETVPVDADPAVIRARAIVDGES